MGNQQRLHRLCYTVVLAHDNFTFFFLHKNGTLDPQSVHGCDDTSEGGEAVIGRGMKESLLDLHRNELLDLLLNA